MIFLSACLPQEKSTQCGSNEAYDSSRRKCVATLSTSDGTVNISNVSPSNSYTVSSNDASKTHSVTVSDPYDNGYQVKWVITYPNGNTTLAGTGLTLTFNHTAYSTGVYILEVQLLSATGTEVYDSRSWTVNIIDEETPSLSAVTPTPLTTSVTSAATLITANASNPDSISDIQYEWYINGVSTGTSGSFSSTTKTLTYSYDPDLAPFYAGAGVYNIQLILTEDETGSTYDSYSWVFTVSTPDFSSVSTGSSSLLATDTPAEASILSVISDLSITSGGFLYDVDSDGTEDQVDFCIQSDDIAGVDGDGVWVDFLVDGTIIAGASNIQLTSADTDYCLSTYKDYTYSLPSNIVAEAHTITASVYDKYTGTTSSSKYKGYNLIKDLTWTIRVRQQNTPPTVIIDNDNTGGLGTLTDCTKTTTTHSSCEITQGTPFRIAIKVDDDDYTPTDFTNDYQYFRVDFLLNGISLDGSHSLSSTDCYQDFNTDSNDSSRYYCDVTINPYDSNGPIDTSGLTYTLTAVVTDIGSPYTTTTKDSNTVTWKVSSVLSINTDPSIISFAEDDGSKTSTSSYIVDANYPTTALDLDNSGISEGDDIQFIVSVSDAERDDFTIQLKRCLNNDSSCSSVDKDIATVVVNSSNDDEVKQTTINHQLTEDAVTGAAQNTVYFQIIVTDTDGGGHTRVVGLLVNNNNPDPTFDENTFEPDVTVNTHTAFAGFPMTFTTGDVTDSSTMDGTTPTFQWMFKLSTDTDWKRIEGATESTLVWIPDPSIAFADGVGVPVNIKVCIGDDGYESGPSGDSQKDPYIDSETDNNCASGAQSQSTVWEITVYSNFMQGGAYNEDLSTFSNQSAGEIATWVDPTSTNPIVKYMAYTNTDHEIVVEKSVIYDDGSSILHKGSTEVGTEELSSIIFRSSTDGSYTSHDITNLSIAGDTTNGALYIAYMTYFGTDAVHIRRINISGGKTKLTHDGKFSWDTEYESDLGNYIVPSTSYNMDALTVNTAGEPVLNFNGAAITGNTSVQFNNINGSSIALVAGTDFCTSTCADEDATATSFATAINEYDGTSGGGLQGITAEVTSSQVTLKGIILDDYIQKDIKATKIGKIMVHEANSKWVLPFINNGRTSSDKNKISLYEGDLGQILDADSTVTHHIATNPAQDLANDIDGNGKIILATKTYGTGLIALYELNTSYSVIDDTTDLFSGETSLSGIKVAVSKETSDFDPSAFVVALNTDNRFAFARVDSSSGNYDFTSIYSSIDLDNGFHMSSTAINNYDITAGASEYQLLLAAVLDPNSGTDYRTYLFNITGASPSIDCSTNPNYPQDFAYCTPIRHTQTPTDYGPDEKVALSNVLKDVTLSTGGATSGENTNHIIGIAHHTDSSGNLLPIMGILNISPLTTSTLDAAFEASTNEYAPGQGKYINPYIGE